LAPAARRFCCPSYAAMSMFQTLEDLGKAHAFTTGFMNAGELKALKGLKGLENVTCAIVDELLERAIASLAAATNQASRRRVRQRLQRRLSDFLEKDQYEDAMQQFKHLCETRLGYEWRVARHSDPPGTPDSRESEGQLETVCYLQFNDMRGQWEHAFV